MATRVQIARPDIVRQFDEAKRKVHTKAELAAELTRNRSFWRLAQSTRAADFIEFLTDHAKLRKIVLKSPTYAPLTRYTWGEASDYQIALSIRPRSYLSHSTAVFLHGLTDSIPRVIHVNQEQSPKPPPTGSLTQQGIDRAFRRPQRQSQLVYSFGDARVVVLNGKYTGGLEVGELPGPDGELLPTTQLERTLIDSVVRPTYAGGVHAVLEAFRAARGRVSINTLVAVLRKLEYAYPYHQAIGFYLDRAGYEQRRLKLLANLGLEYDFYLAHAIKDRDYDPRWRLYFPEGM